MATDIIKSFVFKNGLAADFNIDALDRGVVYFIRTSADKADGYIYFNGKKYGTAAELKAEMEKKMTLSATTYEEAVVLAKDGNLGQIIYVTTDSYDYVPIDRFPEGESASELPEVPTDPTFDSAKYIQVGGDYYQLNTYQKGAYVVTGANTIAPLSTSLPGGQDVAQAVASLQGEVGTIKSDVGSVTTNLESVSGVVVTISGEVDTLKTEVSDIKTGIGTSADTTADTLWGAINSVADNVALETSTEVTRGAGHIAILRNENKELYGVMYYLDDEDEGASAGEETGGTETQA